MTQVVPAPPGAAATLATRRTPPRKGGMYRSRQRKGWAFVAPFTIVFIAFLVVPLVYAFWLSLHTKTLATGERFSGL